MQFVQAHFAHGMAASQTDGLAIALLERLCADVAQQEFGPLRGLHRHCNVERLAMLRSPIFLLIAAFVFRFVLSKTIL